MTDRRWPAIGHRSSKFPQTIHSKEVDLRNCLRSIPRSAALVPVLGNIPEDREFNNSSANLYENQNTEN